MTLKEYVKSLAERIYRIETEGGGGSQGGATKEYVDTKVATATGILQNEINTTNQVVDGNITDVSTLQGQMSTAQGDIAQLEIDVDTNTEDIGKNTTAIGNNTQLINQVNGQVEINTADIGTLSGRVTSVETNVTNTETLIGNKTDLPDTTKSVALNVAQLNNKITSQTLVVNPNADITYTTLTNDGQFHDLVISTDGWYALNVANGDTNGDLIIQLYTVKNGALNGCVVKHIAKSQGTYAEHQTSWLFLKKGTFRYAGKGGASVRLATIVNS